MSYACILQFEWISLHVHSVMVEIIVANNSDILLWKKLLFQLLFSSGQISISFQFSII